MKALFLAVLLLLYSVAFAKDASQQSSISTELINTQAAYREALLNKDITALERIWADNYTFTSGSPKI
jgi:hypothetical protein